jgi:predicted DNA-binding protein with PD1-like motif
MKIVLKDGRRYVLRLDKGEELMTVLPNFLSQEQIAAATFYALGTAGKVELGFFNPFLKDYRKKPFIENLEIVSLVGNCGTMSGKPAIHAHGSFARTDFSVMGGHVFSIETLATIEIFLIKLDGELKRVNNPEFNLNLLD